MANMPIITSARARFAMNKLVMDCICRVVATIQMTSVLPIIASRLMVPYKIDSNTSKPTGTSYSSPAQMLWEEVTQFSGCSGAYYYNKLLPSWMRLIDVTLKVSSGNDTDVVDAMSVSLVPLWSSRLKMACSIMRA